MNQRRSSLTAVILALVALAPAVTAWGQYSSGPTGVVITSSPAGAVVELSGELTLRGVTPWRLDRPVAGTYEVRAYKKGYENWEGYALLSATRKDSVFIRMSRKTPAAAGIRSALLPGWGQFYTGQKAKGASFLLAEVAIASVVGWAELERSDAHRAYDDALRIYQAADQIEETEEAYLEVLRRYDDLKKWHDRRNLLGYIAIGVWAVNVADAVFLFPSTGTDAFAALGDPSGSGLYASIDPEAVTVGVAVRF